MKNYMKVMFLFATLNSSGILVAAAPQKVGIKQHEAVAARVAAAKHGHEGLYKALDAAISKNFPGAPKGYPAEVAPVESPFEKWEIDNVLWPALVWAIEENNEDLVIKIMVSGYIFGSTNKPYGRPVTPKALALYHGHKGLAARIIFRDRLMM